MKARGRRPIAFIVFECLETPMKHEARAFEIASQSCTINQEQRRILFSNYWLLLSNILAVSQVFEDCHCSPHVRESRRVLDSGFHTVDSGFRVLDSGFQLSGFRIPKRIGFQMFLCVLMLFVAFRFRIRIVLF